RGLEFGLGLVDEFAGGRAVFLRQRSKLFHQRGEFAVRADPVAFGVFERGEVRRGFQLRERGLSQRFDFVQGRRHGIFLATKRRKRHKRNCQGRGGTRPSRKTRTGDHCWSPVSSIGNLKLEIFIRPWRRLSSW